MGEEAQKEQKPRQNIEGASGLLRSSPHPLERRRDVRMNRSRLIRDPLLVAGGSALGALIGGGALAISLAAGAALGVAAFLLKLMVRPNGEHESVAASAGVSSKSESKTEHHLAHCQ